MNTISAIIARRYEAPQTPGCLFVFDQDRSVLNVKTLELPWLNNIRQESCIPAGTYNCERLNHPRFGHCWHVKDVPGRSEILFHAGNIASGQRGLKKIMWVIRMFRRWFKIVPRAQLSSPRKVDTEGCIMPGLRFVDINHDGNLDVVDSQKAMDMLRAVLPDKFKLIIL